MTNNCHIIFLGPPNGEIMIREYILEKIKQSKENNEFIKQQNNKYARSCRSTRKRTSENLLGTDGNAVNQKSNYF